MTVERQGFIRATVAAGALLCMLGAVMLTGCSSQKAMQTERLLAASGFHMKLAETAEQQQHLKTMAQKKMVAYQKDGKLYYVYADAADCNCLYAGDEAAYQEYARLAERREIAAEDRLSAEMNYDASMQWGMWGPWPMWGW